MEKRTAKAGIHEKDRSTTSSSVHTVMSSSAPSTTHLSILRGSEKKCTPILTIAPFFYNNPCFFLFQGKTSTISACLFSTETVLSLTYRQTGRRTGRNCMAFGYLILHIPYTSKRRNCRWVEYLWKRRRGERDIARIRRVFSRESNPYFHDDRLHCPDDRLHRSELPDSLYTKSDFVAMKTVVGRKNRAPHGNGLPKALFSIRKQLSEEHLADGFQVIFKMFFYNKGGINCLSCAW